MVYELSSKSVTMNFELIERYVKFSTKGSPLAEEIVKKKILSSDFPEILYGVQSGSLN